MITGEFRPSEKQAGDEVIGGTINGDGSLRVRVTATGDETALSGILRLVKKAQESKSDTQLLADKALALAASIEGDSEHTIARSIRAAAREKGLDDVRVSDFEAIKGHGVKAAWDGKTVYVGGPQLIESLGISPPDGLKAFINRTRQKGQTAVHLIVAGHWVASFTLADVVRPESKQAVRSLHDMDVQVAMLTGDSEAAAKTVTKELSIDRHFAEVLPQDEDRKVQELQKQGLSVAMVGDSVNDAPALIRADIGIAIGSGTDVAVESAGIILVKSNPLDAVKITSL